MAQELSKKAPPVQELMSEKDKEPVEDDSPYICDMIELEKLLKEKGLDRVECEGIAGDPTSSLHHAQCRLWT